MNSNPLKELPSAIKDLSKLIVLGVSYTNLTEIPNSIIDFKDLQ